ncbi:MAG: hypothetical protein IJ393_00945 [Clostridia bacterium]|nr:hypothetical protein [Clostridia bacterium]
MKRKNKFILGTAAAALSLMALGGGMYGLNTETKTASADTVSTSPYCLTYGYTTVDDERTSGCPDNFKVYMKAPRSSGSETIYNGHLTNWSQYYVMIEAVDVTEHLALELYKGSTLYSSISVSGDSDITTNFGGLPSGDYTLIYECRYKKNWLTSNKYFTYEYSFEVDIDKPTYSISAGTGTGTYSYYTNKNVTYSASDPNFSYIRYRQGSSTTYKYAYNNSLTIAATEANNGFWFFQAYDRLGSATAIVNRYIDTIVPVGTVTNQDEDVIANGSATNEPFIYSATDAGTVVKVEYKSPTVTTWTTYPKDVSILTSNGWYYFRATDGAGNVSDEYRVFYDINRPVGNVYDASGMKTSGSITNKSYVKYLAVDTGSGVGTVYVKKPGSSSFTSYTNGSQLTQQGKYYFKAYDKAGNITSTTREITLDTTAPIGQLKAGGVKIASGSVTNAAYVSYEASDAHTNVAACYVKKPGATAFVEYTAGTKLTAEGEYQFYSVDAAENKTTMSIITIDRSIPTAQLYVDGNAIANGSYTNGQYIKFESDGTCFVKKPGATSFMSYVSGTEFYEAGRYEFYAKNEANTTTQTYVLIIDRTPKTISTSSVSVGTKWIDMSISWTDGDAKTTAPITRITINGKDYVFGSIVYTIAGEEYNVVVYDAAGNESTKRFWGGIEDIETFTLQKEYWEVKDGWSDYVYSFQRYESALGYATTAEKRFCVLKTWDTATWDQGIPMDTKDSVNAKNGNYYVYKSESDPEKQVAYFTQERLDEVVKKYAEQTIKMYYYWEKTPESCLDGDMNAYPNENKIVATEVVLREGLIYTLDGVGHTELTITEPGAHTLLIEDGYGGSTEYEIYILDKPQTIQYALGDNTPSTAEFDRTYYFNNRVAVSVPFEGDEFAMFVVYDENGDLIGYYDIANACYIEESGSYTAVAYNHYGGSETFSFVVSMNAPSASLTENTEKKRLDIVVEESADKESNITYLEIVKSVDGGETWETLVYDDYGAEISLDTLEYHFRTSGIYKVVVMDEFRTGIDAVTSTLEYKQADPEGVLAGVAEFGTTNTAVTFTWTDEALVTLTKNGVVLEYLSGQELTEDGSYVLTFSNYDKYQKNYCFVIDTVAPEITLNGVKNGGVVSGDVSATFEIGATAELFKNNESVGRYVSGRKITEDGEYRIVVKDAASNESVVKFTIDKTVEWSININEQGLANSVTATADETVTATLLKDGSEVEYVLGEEIILPGEYTLTLTDSLGNTASRSFTIVQAIVKEFAYDFNRMPNFETVLISGEVRDTNYGILRLTEDGVYEIGVVAAGESYNFTVTVDSTAPALILNGVEDGKTTNNDVSITTTDDNVQVTVYLNGEEIEYTLGDVLTAEGEYRAVAVDLANNGMEVSFAIDKTAPEIALDGVENGGATNGNVSIQADDGTVTVYLNDEVIEYTLGDELTAEGSYFVQAVDSVGNVAEVAFVIDKSAPEITLKGVQNGGKTNGNVTITVADDAAECKVFLNGEEIAYKAGAELKDEGLYKATVKDALGNTVEVTFTIDKTAATLVLNGVENGGTTKKTVSLSDLSEKATVVITKDGETIEYNLGDELNEAGMYVITVTDESGNVSEYFFEIKEEISGWAIVGIVAACVVVLGGVVFIILKKRGVI